MVKNGPKTGFHTCFPREILRWSRWWAQNRQKRPKNGSFDRLSGKSILIVILKMWTFYSIDSWIWFFFLSGVKIFALSKSDGRINKKILKTPKITIFRPKIPCSPGDPGPEFKIVISNFSTIVGIKCKKKPQSSSKNEKLWRGTNLKMDPDRFWAKVP